MTRPNNRTKPAAYLVLALPLLCGGCIYDGNAVSGPITFGAATPGTYNFQDYNISNTSATVVTATLTGVSTGVLQLTTCNQVEMPPDSTCTTDYAGGDRLLLTLTNNTGVSLSGIQLAISGTTFDATSPNDPSRGTLPSSTYASDPNQRKTSPGVAFTASTVNFTFDSALAPGGSTTFYLPIIDNGSIASFQLSETPVQGTPTVPALGTTALIFLAAGLLVAGALFIWRRVDDITETC